MSKIIADSYDDKPREMMPVGNHVARCYRMLHIGSVKETYAGEEKIQNRVIFGFEFPDEQRVFSEEKGMQPFVLNKKFNLTKNLHEKSTLRKTIDGWIPVPLTNEQAKSFNIASLVGEPCMINIVHKTHEASGNKYPSIASISPLPKKMVCPPQITPTVIFGYNPFKKEVFDALPEYYQEEIKKTPQYQLELNPNEGQGDDLPF